jgi:hypothetical protein
LLQSGLVGAGKCEEPLRPLPQIEYKIHSKDLHFAGPRMCDKIDVLCVNRFSATPWQRQDVSVVGRGMLRLYAVIVLFSAIMVIEKGR